MKNERDIAWYEVQLDNLQNEIKRLQAEIPEVPTGATCTNDGFVLRPVIHDPYDYTTWEFVLDEQGSAMTCTFG